jgi:2-polyprenyl-6-methoxyphenol hydroxylase-like FAD-dependent oxidoreductase
MTIEQHEIEELLADELRQLGVAVEWQTRVTALGGHDDRVDVSVDTPRNGARPITSGWVVACDGSRSQVRDWLNIPFEGKRRRNMQVVQGNVVPSWPLADEPGHGYFFLAHQRSIIAFPTPAGGYRIFCVRDDPDPSVVAPPSLEELRDLVAGAAGIPDLGLTLSEPMWLSRARFSDRVAASLRMGRVLLAGDAAHAWAPIGGHGMNVGMLGAHNLAWKLAAVHRNESPDALLDTYSTEQRALAHSVIRDMKFNFMEALLPAIPNRIRCAVLKTALPSTKFQQRGEWIMSDFGRHHGASPLSWQSSQRFRRGLSAGTRIPDIEVLTRSESPSTAAASMTVAGATSSGGYADEELEAHRNVSIVRLHSLLSYDRWTLLVNADQADPQTLQSLREVVATATTQVDIKLIIATDRSALSDFADTKRLILVRPDSYIGLVGSTSQLEQLRDYCATYLVA